MTTESATSRPSRSSTRDRRACGRLPPTPPSGRTDQNRRAQGERHHPHQPERPTVPRSHYRIGRRPDSNDRTPGTHSRRHTPNRTTTWRRREIVNPSAPRSMPTPAQRHLPAGCVQPDASLAIDTDEGTPMNVDTPKLDRELSGRAGPTDNAGDPIARGTRANRHPSRAVRGRSVTRARARNQPFIAATHWLTSTSGQGHASCVLDLRRTPLAGSEK